MIRNAINRRHLALRFVFILLPFTDNDPSALHILISTVFHLSQYRNSLKLEPCFMSQNGTDRQIILIFVSIFIYYLKIHFSFRFTSCVSIVCRYFSFRCYHCYTKYGVHYGSVGFFTRHVCFPHGLIWSTVNIMRMSCLSFNPLRYEEAIIILYYIQEWNIAAMKQLVFTHCKR
jgi:hypothetical protein